jgi:alpha-maltose-1-phosphate synthase
MGAEAHPTDPRSSVSRSHTTTNAMRVVISTISKFHSLDLARQMLRLGVLARVFTARPRWKLRGERLPAELLDTFPYLQVTFEAMIRLGIHRYPFKSDLNWLCHQTLDARVATRVPECDVFHAISYCGLRSGRVVQSRGGRWVCDGVSSHAVYQDRLLADEHERVGIPFTRQESRFLDYAAASYQEADLITVPSTFVRRSFEAEGIAPHKLALVPYGVELGEFGPVGEPRPDGFRVLMVGQLSVRKGVRDLADAFRLAAIPGSQLDLVGPPQPETPLLLAGREGPATRVVGAVPRRELPAIYSGADVMVVASVEEGLSTVIGQAMACGCPVIATENSGAEDFFTDGVEGFIVPIRAPERIAERLTWLYEHPAERRAMREASLRRVQQLGGWNRYGDTMLDAFRTLVRS